MKRALGSIGLVLATAGIGACSLQSDDGASALGQGYGLAGVIAPDGLSAVQQQLHPLRRFQARQGALEGHGIHGYVRESFADQQEYGQDRKHGDHSTAYWTNGQLRRPPPGANITTGKILAEGTPITRSSQERW